ncbi:MAG: hypothetical protein ACK5JO_07200 [Halodesulfovibrio sp.]
MSLFRSQVVLLMIAMSMALCGSAFADERDVLKSLESLKGNVEAGVSYHKYNELIANAHVELNIAERTIKNKEFIEEAKTCLQHYINARDGWKRKIDLAGSYAEQCEQYMQQEWGEAESALERAYSALK